ncbi:MmcQ/YjbR family DNA-binding protein [Jatrophihabitans telluris]|uniref:MmcQ/YjbR family DNA-binding protein n=1 Tax=Jatrophihabitans telluris TaxID=2038343 RepID=A0ABY4R0Q7_9ACTN|nr:MmcQ/YjbR family DNA-binding protein [Jatrophihabitans telluris]UQX89378.1 MmcQ/YjbR family DNA-binding protein [Jatrophihabitans telluris]
MDAYQALAYALGKPSAWADNPFGHDLDLAKVADKIFLFPSAGGGSLGDAHSISVKNTAEAVEEFKARHPAQAGPAPYLNKRLWVRVVLNGLAEEEICELIDDSYDQVLAGLPKSRRPATP